MIWKQKNKRVVFTGHSLGGALATMCGAVTKNEFPELHVSVYTFGSPRVGNKAFVNVFKAVDVSVRCVNGSDIVCSLPFWTYEHVHGEKRIGEKSRVNTTDHSLAEYEKSAKKY
jgi:predicted lipase